MSSISKRKAENWRIVWTAVQFNVLFSWQPVVHWATSALSLQFMALFTAFLAPPPRFCPSETAAQHPPLPVLPLWTSKLCPFLHWGCKNLNYNTHKHAHESPLHTTQQTWDVLFLLSCQFTQTFIWKSMQSNAMFRDFKIVVLVLPVHTIGKKIPYRRHTHIMDSHP